MNWFKQLTAQKKVIAITLAVIVLMLIFPPFEAPTHNGPFQNLGYKFFMASPRNGYGVINYGRVFAQLAGVLLVGGLAYVFNRE